MSQKFFFCVFSAGDHVKFGFPMAWSATTLAWGAIEFRDAYLDAGELRNVLNSLKWATDYFIKAHTAKYELYGQVCANNQSNNPFMWFKLMTNEHVYKKRLL